MDYYAATLLLYILPKIRDCQSRCSDGFPHGKVTWSKWWCTVDSMCPYTCDEGYEKTDPDAEVIFCSMWDEWKISLGADGEDPCKPKHCPNQIPNGELLIPFLCSGTVGSPCELSCNNGYQKKTGVYNLTRLPSTNWSIDPHSLCTSNQQCAYEVANGDLDLSCRRMPGETCNYTCREGYIPSTTTPLKEITCGASRNWSQPLSSLCKSIPTTTSTAAPRLCPTTISNGYISYRCNRTPLSKCDYNCNDGCYKNYSTLDCSKHGHCTLYCSLHGYWTDEKYACICQGTVITDGWMAQFNVSFNSISVISRTWEDDNCPTSNPDASDKIAYVIGVCVGVAFPIAIVFVCFGVCCKRLNQDRACSHSVSHRSQTSLQQPNHTQRVEHRPPLQPHPQPQPTWAGNPQTAEDTPIADEPPEYNSIAKTIPNEAPPSYEQVICNPSDFKM